MTPTVLHFTTVFLTKDPWVLNTVQGYQLEFPTEPSQRGLPYPLNRVSGVTDQHPNNDFESTTRKNEKDLCGGTKAGGSGNCTSQRFGPPTWEDECNIVCDPSCSTLLSPLTNVPVPSSKQQCSVL